MKKGVPPDVAVPILYEGLNAGWLSPEDLSPDLAGIQVWVRLAEACTLHPDGGCPSVAVHEFAVDETTSGSTPTALPTGRSLRRPPTSSPSASCGATVGPS